MFIKDSEESSSIGRTSNEYLYCIFKTGILIIKSSGEGTGLSVLQGTELASPSTHAVISSCALGVLSAMGKGVC